VFVRPEAVQQIAHRTLLAPAASWRAQRWGQGVLGGFWADFGRILGGFWADFGRILGEPFAQQGLIARNAVVTYCPLQTRRSGRACLLSCRAHLTQQRLELPCPRLLQLFLNTGQLPQMRRVAERVTSRVKVARAGPAVVHTRPRV